MSNNYESGSLGFMGAVAMGTGVMIGAGIFALTGQSQSWRVHCFHWHFWWLPLSAVSAPTAM